MCEPEHFKVRSSENRQYIIMMCEQENFKERSSENRKYILNISK